MVGFQDNPDHEYPFVVKRDGTILPELDLVEREPSNATMFYRYLADTSLHHVRFVQSQSASDTTGKDIEHDPWKASFPI